MNRFALSKVDAGFALLIVALSFQQGIAYGALRGLVAGIVLSLYYLGARLLFWIARKIARKIRTERGDRPTP